MDVRFLLARRYLFARRHVSLISVIAWLSVAGVALGVAALIVVLSVMNGFYSFARDLLVSLDPHVRVVAVGGATEAAVDSVRAVALAIPGVERATAYVEGKALVAGQTGADVNKVVVVRGVAPGAIGLGASGEGAPRAVAGAFALGRENGLPGIAMGASLGQRLGLIAKSNAYAGSDVTLLSAQGVERAFASPFGIPQSSRFEVRGLFEMEAAYDESHAFVALEEAQRLFRTPGRVSGLELRLADLERAGDVQRSLRAALGASGRGARFEVLTWYDLHRELYTVMRLEKWGASLILLLIVVVAAFNIVGSLMMIVIEKRRDVGVLAAMGVSRARIRHVFLIEGLLVGLVGTGLGLAIGLGIAFVQSATGIVPLSGGDSFLIASYPVDVEPLDVVVVAAVAVGLCVVAAVYPARRAARVEPAAAVSQP